MAVRSVGNVMALAELTNDTLYTLFPFAIHCYYNTNCIDKSAEAFRVKVVFSEFAIKKNERESSRLPLAFQKQILINISA